MARETRPESDASAERAREIDDIIAALTERGFYVMHPGGPAGPGAPPARTLRGRPTTH